MKVEVLFHSSSTPKIIKDAVSVYTKGLFVCVQKKSGLILKWPESNVFQVAHMHGMHEGSSMGGR